MKGAPDQLLARAGSRPDPEDLSIVPVDDAFNKRYMEENERLASQGLRVMATGRKDFEPDAFDPSADLLPQLDGLTVLALVGIVDPPRPTAKVGDRDRPRRRHPGAHDHRRPCRHGRGDRQ